MTLTAADLATEQATRGPGRHRWGPNKWIAGSWPLEHWGKLPLRETPNYVPRHAAAQPHGYPYRYHPATLYPAGDWRRAEQHTEAHLAGLLDAHDLDTALTLLPPGMDAGRVAELVALNEAVCHAEMVGEGRGEAVEAYCAALYDLAATVRGAA